MVTDKIWKAQLKEGIGLKNACGDWQKGHFRYARERREAHFEATASILAHGSRSGPAAPATARLSSA
jgi:hypothetical protein